MLLDQLLGAARMLRRGVGLSIFANAANAPQRVEGREKPRLVFTVGDDNFSWDVSRGVGGPALNRGPELCGAVVVSVEEYENGGAIRLSDCDANRLLDRRRSHKLTAAFPDGGANPDIDLRFGVQPPEQNRQGVHFPVALDDRPDRH